MKKPQTNESVALVFQISNRTFATDIQLRYSEQDEIATMVLMRTAVLAAVLSTMVSSVSASGVHYRPKTSTVKGRSSSRRLQAKEERCRYLVSKSKGGKGVTGSNRHRRAAVPNETFVQQEVKTVYYDQKTAPAPSPDVAPLIRMKGKAPAGSEWYYEDGKHGGEDPNPTYDYVKCETPSAQPSLSTRPSLSPTKTPSLSPTALPSLNPSPSPTISQLPSISQNPTLSLVPTQGPTMDHSPACDELANNKAHVHTKNTTVYIPDDQNGYYEYQMVFQEDIILGELVNDVEEVLQSILSDALIWCPTSGDVRQMRALSSRVLMSEANPEMVIDGIDLYGTEENKDKKCSVVVTNAMVNGEKCMVFKGEFTTYLREQEDNPTRQKVNAHVLSNIKNAMSNNKLADATEADKIVFEGAVETKDKNTDTVGLSAGERAKDPSANSISTLGGSIVGFSVLMTLIFLFAATRKREHHKLKVVEQVFEDDESIFGNTNSDMMSNGSDYWKTPRGAHVVGEDDSVYSDFDGHDILADMKKAETRHLYGTGSRGIRGPQEDNLGARGDSLDVHNCTSATCQICKGRNGPMFVNSDMLSPIVEVSPSRELVSPITPSYADTIDMDRAERKYMSADTVDM